MNNKEEAERKRDGDFLCFQREREGRMRFRWKWKEREITRRKYDDAVRISMERKQVIGGANITKSLE